MYMYVYNTASALLWDNSEGICRPAENKTGQLLGATLFSNGETFMVSDPILYLSLSKSSIFLLSYCSLRLVLQGGRTPGSLILSYFPEECAMYLAEICRAFKDYNHVVMLLSWVIQWNPCILDTLT